MQTILLRIDPQRFAGATPESTGEIATPGGCLDP
jgi:hypothetical protein